jgi:hypothetical protein
MNNKSNMITTGNGLLDKFLANIKTEINNLLSKRKRGSLAEML